MIEEKWVDITDYTGCYQVSNLGRVYSLPRIRRNKQGLCALKGRILKMNPSTKGYLLVGLSKYCQTKTHPVHRLVAEAFIPNPENKPEVNHKDGNKLNNQATNLEWATQEGNAAHAFSNNLRPRGTMLPHAKLKEQDIPLIRNRIKSGDDLGLIASDFRVSKRAISAIEKNESWKHVP